MEDLTLEKAAELLAEKDRTIADLQFALDASRGWNKAYEKRLLAGGQYAMAEITRLEKEAKNAEAIGLLTMVREYLRAN